MGMDQSVIVGPFIKSKKKKVEVKKEKYITPAGLVTPHKFCSETGKPNKVEEYTEKKLIALSSVLFREVDDSWEDLSCYEFIEEKSDDEDIIVENCWGEIGSTDDLSKVDIEKEKVEF